MPQDAKTRREQRAAKTKAEGRRFVSKGAQPKAKQPAVKDAAKTSFASTDVKRHEEAQPPRSCAVAEPLDVCGCRPLLDTVRRPHWCGTRTCVVKFYT